MNRERTLRTKSRLRYALAACIGTTVLSACAPPAALHWDTTTLATCQKKIEVQLAKLDKKLSVALAKCKDLYRRDTTGGGTLSAGSVSTCSTRVDKAMLYPDPNLKSAVSKAKANLDNLVTFAAACSDKDLLALGHAPTAALGDHWSRLAVLGRIKAAYEAQLQSVSDTADIFKAYAAAGCSNCAPLAEPPCRRTECRLAASSTLDLGSTPTAIQGSIPLDLCRSSSLMGPDFGVFAAPTGQTLAAFDSSAPSAGAQYACIRVVSAEGQIQGTGTTNPGAVGSDVCQDHIVNPPDTDECATPGAICSSPSPDPQHPGVTNGGACITFLSASVAGSALVMARFELSLVGAGLHPALPDTRGPDGLPCTADDTAVGPTVSYTLPLSTGFGVSASVKDANDTDGNVVSGGVSTLTNLFDPDKVEVGDLSGGRFGGALPGLHTLKAVSLAPPYSDQIAEITLDCQ